MKFLILFALVLLLTVNSEAANLDLFKEAGILYYEGRFNEAIALYEQIIKSNPQNIKAYLNLAYLYKDLAEYKKAIRIIRSLPQSLRNTRLRKLLGQLYYLKGEPRQGFFYLEQLLPSHPDDHELLLYLGLCYEDIGDLKKAEVFYLDVVRLKPNNVLAYLKLGNIYYRKQRLKEAIQMYQKIIDLDPSITQVRSRLAECFMKLDKFTEAYRQYAKCIAIDPYDELLKVRLEETKTKLGKDFFRKREKEILQRRKIKSIQVKVSPFAEGAPWMRVGIAKIKGSIEFKCGRAFEILDKQSDESLFQGRKELIYALVFNKKLGIQLKDYQGNFISVNLNKPLLIKNKSPNSVITIFDLSCGRGNFWAGWDDKQYRGAIEVIPGNEGFQLVNIINLEEYLYSVLPSEMPANWPRQALCAQAIAARTWAVRNKNRHKREGFNFCSSVHCQVYRGAGVETKSTNQAVDDTAGIILVSDNQPIDIFYSNNCGGCTRSGIIDASSLDIHLPFSVLELQEWLMGKPETFCNLGFEKSANFRWVRIYKKEQLEALLEKSGFAVGGLTRIIPQRRTRSGHLISIKIEGGRNSEIIEGENNIRKILGGLRSSAFKVETKIGQQNAPAEFIFYGGGFGHGKGLCQTGLKGMALRGYNYLEIIRHYFPNSEIKKIY